MLAALKAGDRAVIKDISGANSLVRRRLLDLGITEGATVSVKCMMPFGGPIMLESCGQCVGIRRNEAWRIEVEKE